MKINKNSWHYKMLNAMNADVIHELKNYRTVDGCDYFRSVLGHILFVLFVVALAFAMGVGIGTLFYKTYLAITVGTPDAPIVAVFWFMSLVMTVYVMVRRWRENRPAKERPSVLREMYRAHKEKYCPVVELEKE